ncbi:MAG: PadR family transcriptional regulator [Clostridiales bacterium]|nr:PadR family transcriptional regulator [Clostridiales bacterium]
MADYVGGDMIRGHIDTIILNSLIDGDKDTNQIRAEIEGRAGGQFQLKQGTFYSALQRIVKQGYVIEYRTTGPDGVRRKYFQLTEKGKDLIDKNQSSWTFSRQVINTLLDASQSNPSSAVTAAKPEEDEVIPSFNDTEEIQNFSNLDNGIDVEEKTVAEEVISSIDEIDETEEIDESSSNVISSEETVELAVFTEETPPIFDPENEENSTPQTFDDIMDILESIDKSAREEEEKKLREEEQRLERERILAAEKAKAEEEERLIAAQVEKQRSERENVIPDVKIPDEFELAEKRSKNPYPLHDEEEPTPPVIPDYIKDSLAKNEKLADEIDETIIVLPQSEVVATNEPDDFLNINDLPVQKEYKTVLERIFANDSKQIPVQPVEQIETEDPVKASETTITQEDSGDYDRIVDELDLTMPANEPKGVYSDPALIQTKAGKKSGSFDYSDIIALSQKEGFKINTADKTNKNELGKILINRLNFHTSIIFFILMALETLLIGLSMEKLLQYGIEPYIYFSIAVLAFPIITGMVYYMAPKRTVAEVSNFKSAFETALIITLNLILLILVYAVVIDLDFSSHFAIARNLFVPLMMVINVPIFVIIRYSLLEKQMYFS